LAPDEIELLIKEANTFSDADSKAKEMVVLRNKLESLLRNTQKAFTKFGGVLSSNDQEIAQRIFREGEKAITTDKLDDINKALSNLERTAAQLTAAMLNPTKDTPPQSAEER
jgi:molecular chaperone DnaK (HSP70)